MDSNKRWTSTSTAICSYVFVCILGNKVICLAMLLWLSKNVVTPVSVPPKMHYFWSIWYAPGDIFEEPEQYRFFYTQFCNLEALLFNVFDLFFLINQVLFWLLRDICWCWDDMSISSQRIVTSWSNPFVGYNVASYWRQKRSLVPCWSKSYQPSRHTRLQGTYSIWHTMFLN